MREPTPDVEEFAVRNKLNLLSKAMPSFSLISTEKKVRIILQNYPTINYPIYLI